MQHKNLLLIGGLPNKIKKLGYGGATVLMQNFVDFLSERSIKFKFVQTNKYFNKDGKPNGLLNKIYFILKYIRKGSYLNGNYPFLFHLLNYKLSFSKADNFSASS